MTDVEHLPGRREDVARYVFVPGDPDRVPRIAERWDEAAHVGSRREYTMWTGTSSRVRMSAVSTGIGCPSTAIAVEELHQLGADTLIRLGTAGAVPDEDLRSGDLVIASAAIRDEGTTMQYVPPGFPAVADIDVTFALRDAAADLGIPCRIGVTQSKDSFYGEIDPDRQPVAARLKQRWAAWQGGGALVSEMEASTLYVVGQILGLRTSAMVVIAPNDPDQVTRMLDVGVRAVQLLAERDAD